MRRCRSASFTRLTQRLQKAHSPSKKRSIGWRAEVRVPCPSGIGDVATSFMVRVTMAQASALRHRPPRSASRRQGAGEEPVEEGGVDLVSQEGPDADRD